MRLKSWVFEELGEPMVLLDREEHAGAREVIVEVAGCGVCHTDLGFYFEGVNTRHALPLTLGHEISGTVVQAGPGAESWVGKDVVVPAVIPCGECDACRDGHGGVCPSQVFPGNDVHGGFATHVRVPATGLCAVPDLGNAEKNPLGLELWSLSVIADAVSTPYQAIARSKLGEGDLAVFVGCGGVGGFGVQIAAALGAHVVAIDPSADRLEQVRSHGASLALQPDQLPFKDLRGQVRAFAKERGIPTWRRKIFETSGTAGGQTTAFGLLEHGGYLSLVGFTRDKVQIRLSNLMALDAVAEGNWGCLPEHYPAIVDLVLSGKVKIDPFVERRPLDTIEDAFADVHQRRALRRIVLVPQR